MIAVGSRKPQYYKNILMKADPALHAQVAESVNELARKGVKILDFGAGEGALSLRLSDMGHDVTAVDVNADSFRPRDITFIKLDFNNQTDVDAFVSRYQGCFDIVLGVEVIEHLENPWEYIRTLKKMVKPMGHMIITTPNVSSWLSRMKFLATGRFHSFADSDVCSSGHITPVHEAQIKLIFASEKITLISLRAGGTLPFIWVTRSMKINLLNILSLFLRPMMRGMYNGYCVIAVGQKHANG